MAARTDICLFCGLAHRGACGSDKPKEVKPRAPRKKAEAKPKVEPETVAEVEVPPPPMKRTAFAAMKKRAKPEQQNDQADELSGDEEAHARALRALDAVGLIGPESRREFRQYLTAPLAGDRRIADWKERVSETAEDHGPR